MPDGTVVVYANEEPPAGYDASVFLAGPTPREQDQPSWRPEALALLAQRWAGPGRLAVFVPEPRAGIWSDYGHQIVWEDRYLSIVDVILFWVPREMTHMPGLTTNVEFGRYESSGRVVLGAPPEAVRMRYLRHHASLHGAPVLDALPATIDAALDHIGDGAFRTGAHRDVPLLLWRQEAFQAWLPPEFAGGRVVWHRSGVATLLATGDELVAFSGDSFTVLHRT